MQWRDQDKRDEARDLLVSQSSWFTKGLGSLDLKNAKTVLGGLAS